MTQRLDVSQGAAASGLARPRQGSPLSPVGKHPRVHCGEVFRCVVAGPPTNVQHGDGPAVNARGCAGLPVFVR